MLRVQLMPTLAKREAETRLKRWKETGINDDLVHESNWEVLAWMVELLQTPAYADLAAKVEFFRDDHTADGRGGLTKYSLEEMKTAIVRDIECRPLPD